MMRWFETAGGASSLIPRVIMERRIFRRENGGEVRVAGRDEEGPDGKKGQTAPSCRPPQLSQLYNDCGSHRLIKRVPPCDGTTRVDFRMPLLPTTAKPLPVASLNSFTLKPFQLPYPKREQADTQHVRRPPIDDLPSPSLLPSSFGTYARRMLRWWYACFIFWCTSGVLSFSRK